MWRLQSSHPSNECHSSSLSLTPTVCTHTKCWTVRLKAEVPWDACFCSHKTLQFHSFSSRLYSMCPAMSVCASAQRCVFPSVFFFCGLSVCVCVIILRCDCQSQLVLQPGDCLVSFITLLIACLQIQTLAPPRLSLPSSILLPSHSASVNLHSVPFYPSCLFPPPAKNSSLFHFNSTTFLLPSPPPPHTLLLPTFCT